MENNNKKKDQDDTECESMGEDTTNDDGTLPFSPRGEELLSPEISLMSPFLSISSTSPKKKGKRKLQTTTITEPRKKLSYNHVTPFDQRKNKSGDSGTETVENKQETMNLSILRLQKLKKLTDSEVRVITQYGKNELFPRMKFVDRFDTDLLFGGSIMKELFDLLNYTKENNYGNTIDLKLKIRDIYTALTTQITSRRCYVRDQVETIIKRK